VTAYVTVEQVAELLHISTRTVHSLVSRRQLPHRRIAGTRRVLFVPAELEARANGAELEVLELPRGGRVVRPKAAV